MRECRKCRESLPETEFRPQRHACKNCERAYFSERYAKNTSQLKAKALAYYYKNPERYHARAMAWALANPEKAREINRRADLKRKDKPERKEKRRAHWLQNKEEIKARLKSSTQASQRKYYAAHKEKKYEANKRRRLKDPALSRRYAKDRQLRIRGVIIRDLTQEQWEQRLKEFDYHCAYCWASDTALTQDHLIPISKGGGHTIDNVVPACRPCNSRKKNRSMLEVLRVVS